jgi:hypothetical protein
MAWGFRSGDRRRDTEAGPDGVAAIGSRSPSARAAAVDRARAPDAGVRVGALRTAPASWVLFACVAALLVAGIVAWWRALADTNLSATGGVGLLNAFPVTFYLAVALVVGAVVLTLVWAPFSRLACSAGLVTFVLVIFGTPAVLYSEPQYAWVYKHIGVIRYLELHGSVNRSVDIYQNWPGSFAANAWLAKATGLDPLRYAAWAPVFFDLCLLAAVLYAFGGIISSPRRRYGAAFLWLVGSWIGQDYLSPQAMTVVMVVVVLGVVLRIGGAGGWNSEPRTDLGRFADALRGRAARRIHRFVRSSRPLGSGASATSAASHLDRRDRIIGIALILLLSAAIITSHQLSPGTMLFDLILLVIVTGWRRLWPIILVIGIGEIAWILLAWPVVSKFGLLTIDGPVTPVVSRGVPLAGVALVQDASRAMGIAFWVLALTGVVRMLRRVGGDPASPAAIGALALCPYLVIPVQSYGGEAALRAYLFSLPWLAVLSLEAIWPSGARVDVGGDPVRSHETPGTSAEEIRAGTHATGPQFHGLQGLRHRPWLVAIVAPVLVVGLLFSYYGYALSNEMTASDVVAATWVEQNVPADATVVLFGPSLPNRLTARYPLVNYYGLTLATEPTTVAEMRIPGQGANAVRGALAATGRKTIYLVVTPSMGNYDRLNGLFSDAQMSAVVKELHSAPDFKPVYDQGGSFVFRWSRPAP